MSNIQTNSLTAKLKTTLTKACLAAAIALCSTSAQAQSIFTYGNTAVSKDEFLRMYTKNSMQRKVDMSQKALREYITLYSRFKMKVAEAELAKIDTIPSIKGELDNYKKQLAKNYLTDKDVVSNLSKEAHERLKKDVQVAHIMISLQKGVTDTTAAYTMADSVYRLAQKGEDFFALAKTFSQDKSTAQRGGDIGYITALQTPYEFETVSYNTPVGKVSKVFRSPFGFHIIKKLAERPALGEVTVAQIMLPVKSFYTQEQKDGVKRKADSLIAALQKGGDWNACVAAFSEDKYSVSNNGELQPFGISTMTPEFEKAAFALTKPQQLAAEPVLTTYGYHVIKLIKRNLVKPFDSMKTELGRKIEKDGRVEMARQEFLKKVKQKNNLKEMPENVALFAKEIPDTCIKNGFLVLPNGVTKTYPLFSIKNKSYGFNDFYNYIMESSRGRLFGDKMQALKVSYQAMIDKTVMDVEETNLSEENQEFKTLLKEYRDGIILFDLTDKSVWTKASTDSNGLAAYYEQNKSKYVWSPAFEGKICRSASTKDINEFATLANMVGVDSALTVMNSSEFKISSEEGKFEYDKVDAAAKLVKAGGMSAVVPNKENGGSVYVVSKVFETASPKSLQDAKGYVIADYQDYLEKEWIASMERKYPVKVNEAVLKSISKK